MKVTGLFEQGGAWGIVFGPVKDGFSDGFVGFFELFIGGFLLYGHGWLNAFKCGIVYTKSDNDDSEQM
jgi:hypothetical protein